METTIMLTSLSALLASLTFPVQEAPPVSASRVFTAVGFCRDGLPNLKPKSVLHLAGETDSLGF